MKRYWATIKQDYQIDLTVLDTSAITAIIQDEPESPLFITNIEIDQFIQHLKVNITPVTPDQAEIAREGYREYGKGNRPAGLNVGGCFSYALANSTQEELLFKGDDFAKTDVKTL